MWYTFSQAMTRCVTLKNVLRFIYVYARGAAVVRVNGTESVCINDTSWLC